MYALRDLKQTAEDYWLSKGAFGECFVIKHWKGMENTDKIYKLYTACPKVKSVGVEVYWSCIKDGH